MATSKIYERFMWTVGEKPKSQKVEEISFREFSGGKFEYDRINYGIKAIVFYGTVPENVFTSLVESRFNYCRDWEQPTSIVPKSFREPLQHLWQTTFQKAKNVFGDLVFERDDRESMFTVVALSDKKFRVQLCYINNDLLELDNDLLELAIIKFVPIE